MPHIQLKDFKMHYSEHDHGPEPVVFVHGFISSHRWWLPTLQRLRPDIYHAYAIDLRATGESDQIETGHTFEQYADDLHQFVEALRLPKFTLVGHSMGGQIAMLYALQHQAHLKALVLVDPVAPSGNKIAPEILEWCYPQQGNPEGIRLIVLGAFATPPTGEYLEQLVTDGVRWGKTIYLATLREMLSFNVVNRLGEIKVPTLAIWGDKDISAPFPGIVEVFTGIPGCGLEVWHGVGHSGPIEVPDRFVDVLSRFIAEVSAQAQAQPQ